MVYYSDWSFINENTDQIPSRQMIQVYHESTFIPSARWLSTCSDKDTGFIGEGTVVTPQPQIIPAIR
jgi:hypothetical protein